MKIQIKITGYVNHNYENLDLNRNINQNERMTNSVIR